jgi:hypothetical protein
MAAVAAVSLWCGLGSSAPAASVDWSSPILTTNLTSTGAPLDDSWVFELGAFSGTFIPTSANTAQWAANWVPAQREFYNIKPLEPGIPRNGFTGRTYELTSNAPPFSTNRFGYIWGHNCSTSNGEWILVSASTWKWPLYSPGNPGGSNVSWSIIDATNIIVGQLNGSGFFMKMAAVGSAPLPTIPPTDWKSIVFSSVELANPAISSWNADPDVDGMSNLLEYAMGRDPLNANLIGEPTLSWHTIGASKYLKLSAPRCGYSQATLAIEVSGNLQSWSSSAADVETLTSNSDMLVVRDRTATGAALKRFIRLKASVP